ncbi:MAG: phytanoyl-CoA dioxygenase family protein [Chloroflexi bacterium]|nr:phytanoyl-CoA dioxygenase family protein [Chloroflexota bacterium]
MQPIPSVHELFMHVWRLEHVGYTAVPNAISPERLEPIRERFDALIADYENVPSAVVDGASTSVNGVGSIDLHRFFELDPLFEDFMDLPTVLPIVQAARNHDVVLLSSGMGNYRAPNSPAATLWHRDGGPYMRLTICLDDVTEEVGPTAVVPGSHRDPNRPPAWANHDNQPRALPGMVPLTAPAGTCLINDTNIWHTAMPNRSSRPRRLVWVVYKWSTQVYDVRPEWHHTPEFIARQTDPVRRALLGCTD